MKNLKPLLLFLILLTVKIIPQYLEPQAGGEYKSATENCICLSAGEHERIMIENQESINKLISDGVISLKKSQAVSFSWPLKLANNMDDYGYYGISNFVDHNPAPGALLDYNNGTRTYDLSNYNHQGTDIFTWPFPWYKMDYDEVEIVAAADGIIINKSDGNNDRSCGLNGGQWNAVYVQHSDGSVAWYGHMKKNSLTTKIIGSPVTTGEYLGIVGSSGNSTGPHLHFEVYDSENHLIDPWFGPSNPSTTSSWWGNQKPYFDPKINKVATHSAWPVTPPCPQQEVLNLKNNFSSGDTVFFITYYQDQLRNMISSYKVYTPENIVWSSWTHAMTNDSFYVAAWWGWYNILPSNASPGNWRFSVVFNGLEYSQTFQVNMPNDVKDNDEIPNLYFISDNFPNPFNPSTKINYYIPRYDLITIKMYDILGNQLEVLENSYKPSGNYELTIDGSSLNSGVYFVNFKSGSFNETRKIVLAK